MSGKDTAVSRWRGELKAEKAEVAETSTSFSTYGEIPAISTSPNIPAEPDFDAVWDITSVLSWSSALFELLRAVSNP